MIYDIKTLLLFILVTFFVIVDGYGRKTEGEAGLVFIENKGQHPEQVLFSANIPGGSIFLEKSRIVFNVCQPATDTPYVLHKALPKGEQMNCHAFAISFNNLNGQVATMPEGQVPTRYNYIRGQRKNWVANARGYRSVLLKNEKVSIRIYSSGLNLKYDIISSPEEMKRLHTSYEGFDQMSTRHGNLILQTSIGEMMEDIPWAYQGKNETDNSVRCSYRLEDNRVYYHIESALKPMVPVTIDPILIFSTFSGSTEDNWGNTATPDNQGNLISAGITAAEVGKSYPTTLGAYQQVNKGNWDIGIIKYDSLGTHPIYSTYLGGSSSEIPQSLVVNSKGELLIMGVTSSSDFPTLSNGYDPTFNGGDAAGVLGIGLDNGTDVFVAMLDETGSTLVGHTFLGGSGNDGIMMPSHSLTNNYGDESRGDVYTDENDNIYVASKTASVDFPVVNGIENTHQGGALDAVVVKLKSDLSDILWSTYLGGSGLDAAYSIKKNQAGIVVVAGGTSSADIHAGFMNGFSGIVDGWVALINDTVPALISGQYLGTPQYDQAYFIDLDLSDNIYLYGQTSGDYPVQGNVYQMGDGQFIHKFSPDLSQSLMSTNFGSVHSGPDISPTAFMVNDCNNIYLSGWGGFVNEGYMGGSTNDMPVTVDAYQPITSGSDFYLAVFVDDAQELLYATFLGGTESKTHVDGGTCRFDKKGMVYHAVCSGCQAGNSSGGSSSDFPTTPGAWSATNNSYNCNNAAFKFDLSSLKAGILTNSINLDQPGIASVCLPDQVVFQNTSVGGETFIWDFGNGKRLNTIYDEDIIFQYTDPGTYKVKLRIIDRSTCTETDSTFVFLNVHQPEFDVVENGEMCENEQFYLSASGGVQYRWKDETGNVFSQSPGQAVNPQQDAMYYIDITDSNGCEFSDSVRVEVFPVAEIDFDYERECSTGPDFSFHGQPGDADSVWFDLGNNQLISGQEIVYTYDKEGTFPVTFYAKKGKCINNVVKTIEAFDIRVPSVITPGITDGKNDSFKVFGGSKIDVIIYNRWGGAVFEEEDYQNDWKGDDVGAGTYYYNITFNGSCTCKGWVQVMK